MAVIAIDIDGVICEEEKTFDKPLALPISGAVESINSLFGSGNTIILWTARGWEQYRITVAWLEKYKVNYHSLIMGKPIVDIFIDDRAIGFKSWHQTLNEITVHDLANR